MTNRPPLPINTRVIHEPSGTQCVVYKDEGKDAISCVIGEESLGDIMLSDYSNVWPRAGMRGPLDYRACAGDILILPLDELLLIGERHCKACLGTGKTLRQIKEK